MPRFTKRDAIIVLILGEIVGLFAYAIAREIEPGITSLPIALPALALGVPIAAFAALVLTYILGKRVNPSFFQFGKFAAVGFSNTAIDWGVLNLLISVAAVTTNFTEAMFKALSFVVATLNSFIWNRFWSFEQKGSRGLGKQAVQFYAVTIVGFFINVTVFAFVNGLGPDSALWTGIVAPAAGTATTMFWNFFGYKLIVFKR